MYPEILLVERAKRLSTDIDIVVEPGTNVDKYIEEASKIFPFKSVEQQVRIGRDNIEKRHYRFLYDSPAFGKEFYNSYMSTVKAEISYRGGEISIEDVLWDTIDSAASIASRGTIGEDYNLFLSGIKKIATHIFDGKFNAEIAILGDCKVMYIAACILHNVPIQKISDFDEYRNANISKSKYKNLVKFGI